MTVTLRLPRQGDKLLRAVMVKAGDPMVISYRHSVEGTNVEGWFTVGAGPKLLAVKTRMDSAGTGLPNVAPGRSQKEGSWRVVDEGRRELSSLRFFISPLNRPRLAVAGEAIPLGGLPAGSLISLAPEKVSWGRYLWWRAGGRPWTRPEE